MLHRPPRAGRCGSPACAGRCAHAHHSHPPHRRADAGEPFVRQLLRHLSGCRRAARRHLPPQELPECGAGLRSTLTRGWRGGARAEHRSQAVRASVPRRPHGRIPRRLPHRKRAGRIAQPTRLLRRTRSSVRLEPGRALRAVRQVLLVGAGRQRLEPPVRRHCDARQPRADELPPRGYPDTTTIFDRLEAAGIPWRFYVKDYDPTNTMPAPSWRPRFPAVPGATAGDAARVAFARAQVQYRRYAGVLPRCAGWTPARGLVHRAWRGQRAPAGEARRGADIRALDRQRADAEPRMEQHRLRTHLRQLGGLVRPRPTAEGGSLRLRVPSAGAARQPVCEARSDRPRHARLHVDPALHRGQLAARPARPTRRERPEHRDGVRLLASAARSRVHPGDSRLPDGRDGAYPRGLLGVWRRRPARARADRGCAGGLAPATLARRGRATGERAREAISGEGAARQPWERQPEEPGAAWHAFVLYRDMGSGSRSQRAVRAALRLEPPGAPPESRMRQWSVEWRWVERCRAYDSYTALEGSR